MLRQMERPRRGSGYLAMAPTAFRADRAPKRLYRRIQLMRQEGAAPDEQLRPGPRRIYDLAESMAYTTVLIM
jgi:hypothetical protein